MNEDEPNKPSYTDEEAGEKMVKTAKDMAFHAHQGQARRDGRDYTTHLNSVAKKFHKSAYTLRTVAWLHDILEDTDTPVSRLYQTFPDGVVDAVCDLTHNKDLGEDYLYYLFRVKRNSIARAVKLADLEHNLGDNVSGNQRDKYLMAQYILEE